MATVWQFKQWLATERGIHTATDLRQEIREQANVEISLQALSVLLNQPPQALRVRTMQAISDAFGCELNEFFNVVPGTPGEAMRTAVAAGGTRRLYRSRARDEDEVYPNPALYRKLG